MLPVLAGLLEGCFPTTETSSQPIIYIDCDSWGCGSNTPIALGAPIEGVHLFGEPNGKGIRLIHGSLRGGGCGDDASLDVQGGALLGRDAEGQVVCQGQDVVGATFDLEVRVGEETLQASIQIAEMGEVFPWHIVGEPVPLPTYLMVEEQTGTPICPQDEAWMEPWQLAALDPDLAVPWGTPTRHAVLVRGETYDGTYATVELTGEEGADWFNIACSGTAIAKMRLLGYDPAAGTSEHTERQATLKMITAKYCGWTSFTERGMPVRWQSTSGTQYHGTPAPAQVHEIEARWGEQGPVCLSHARAWREGHELPDAIADYCLGMGEPCDKESHLIELLRDCEIPECTGTEPAYWTTHTVDHVDH